MSSDRPAVPPRGDGRELQRLAERHDPAPKERVSPEEMAADTSHRAAGARPADDVIVVRETYDSQRGLTIAARPNMPIHLCPSTLGTDKEGIRRRFNAMGQSTLELDRDGTLLIEVADVFCYWRDHVDEKTGEVSEFSWLVLIDSAGETFGTSSEVVASKMGQLLALRSAGRIEWPCPIQIVTKTAQASKRRYHDVILL